MPGLALELRRVFGFDAFRPGQEQVVRAALDGRDTLALMPTGSGKSLTYQLAAMLRPTPTLVLSPLIALMKDQVDKLPDELARQATFVNSSLSPEEVGSRLADVAAGRVRLLYAAPERLRQAAFVRALHRIDVGLVVVDEVHCVSMWGHDFRPDYLFIRRALTELGEPALLGMTATATPATAREIAEALGRSPEVVRTSVARPNLRYDVEHVDGAEGRLRVVIERLRRADGGAAIVYARSRESCERLARILRGHGFRAAHYHAGLASEDRTSVQDAFVGGRTQVVVATTAFGMGIDKPDVRLVCLVNFPDSLESYVQMVGRAGRDGEPSETVLVASPSDAATLRRFVREDVPSLDELRTVYRAAAAGTVEPDELAAVVGKRRDPRVLVGLLVQAGLVERGFDSGRAMSLTLPAAPGDATSRIESVLARLEQVAIARAERIVDFAQIDRCRHAQVAEHFGEELDAACAMCDVCSEARRPAPGPNRTLPAPPLPDDVGRAIADAVAALRWPVGRRSLVAMLRGSLEAPPSARRAESFGLLAAASEADVRRWLGLLLAAGALTEVDADGYRVVVPDPTVDPPSIRPAGTHPVDAGVVERLKAWRLERSRADGVPAYVVLHDATLGELAAAQPRTLADLAAVKGFGPVKLDRYGTDVLAVVGAP